MIKGLVYATLCGGPHLQVLEIVIGTVVTNS